MNLDSNLLHTLRYFKTFEENEQDKYFREKLNRLGKLNMSSYEDLMRRYVMKAALEGSVDMERRLKGDNEFDRDIDELLSKEGSSFIKLNKEDSQDFLNTLENPPEPNEALLEAAQLHKETIKEEKNMPLAKNEKFVYKKKVSTNQFVKVGVVDECGYVDFYDTDKKVDLYNLGLYYPHFFMEIVNTKEVKQVSYKDGEIVGTKLTGNYITGTYKKEFVPRNLPQQIFSLVDSIFLKPEEYYVTGYVNREGRVYYYDQYV